VSVKSYLIGETKYTQQELVYGQIRQLQEVLEGLRLPNTFDRSQLLTALGERISLALAVVLIPEGGSAKGKDLPALADQIEWDILPEQIFEVVDDFFTCNPIAVILKRLKGVIGTISEKVLTGLKQPSVSSPAETSPEETPSSGDSPREKPSLT
jgi:hypothetical protein